MHFPYDEINFEDQEEDIKFIEIPAPMPKMLMLKLSHISAACLVDTGEGCFYRMCMYVCMYVYMCICVYVCICICVHVCLYIYI